MFVERRLKMDESVELKEERVTVRNNNWSDLSPQLTSRIWKYLSFEEISKLRMVCRSFNESGKQFLNDEARRILNLTKTYIKAINKKNPRGSSPWFGPDNMKPKTRKYKMMAVVMSHIHPLCNAYQPYINANSSCFVAGKILDLVNVMLSAEDASPDLIAELKKLQTKAYAHFDKEVIPLFYEGDVAASGEPFHMDASWLLDEPEPSDQLPGPVTSSKIEAEESRDSPIWTKCEDEMQWDKPGCSYTSEAGGLAAACKEQHELLQTLHVIIQHQQMEIEELRSANETLKKKLRAFEEDRVDVLQLSTECNNKNKQF